MLQSNKLSETGQAAATGPANEFAEAFGRALLERRLLDAAGFERAKRAALQTGERFDRVLAKLGLVAEALILEALAQHFGLALATARDAPSAPVLPETIRAEFVRSRQVLPLAADDEHLDVAVVDPFDEEPGSALSYLTGCAVNRRLMAASDFLRAAQALYEGFGNAGHGRQDPRLNEASESDVERLRDIANEAPVIRLVNQLIGDAVVANASDIHFQPDLDGVSVRYRIDGRLRQAQLLPPGMRAAVTSRIKIMAKLNIAERRLPQDGRIKSPVRGVDIDFRVSTIPTAHGEGIVVRILDRSRVELDFSKLGFDADRISQLQSLMDQPNGIVLVTGPTGSGKTTTLYTALKGLNRPDVKVFTVEDPIEYQLAGVTQVQVHPAIGLDFPHALRSILRQDPDIIMIGEIRDLETARIAVQASLTGHLVFSTLHTNSAAATLTRLVDMGVENFLLASTVNGVLAQRLVRRLCQECAAPHRNSGEWRERIRREWADLRAPQEFELLEPCGCEACSGSGFSGRIAISELMIMDQTLSGLILRGASDAEIDEAARRDGMKSMFEDGLEKAIRGETTIEEVLRVTRMM